MTIASYLDLSTKYITAQDAILLGEHGRFGPSGMIVVPHPYGWFVHIEQNPEDLAVLIPRIRARGYSATFIGLLYLCERPRVLVDQPRPGRRG